MDHLVFLDKAIEKASESVAQGGFPAGAVIVKNGQIVGSGISIGNCIHDPTSHGELSAIRDACKNLSTSNLSDCTLYASMEPCMMCLNAVMWSSIPKIVFACSKDKVTPEYYGGKYHTSDVNKLFASPIEIVYSSEREAKSIDLVRKWEKSWAESK